MPNQDNSKNAQDAAKEKQLDAFIRDHGKTADWVGIRHVREVTSSHDIRDEKPDGHSTFVDEGAMIEVMVNGHIGYAATSDLSTPGLRRALDKALLTTRELSSHRATQLSAEVRPRSVGRYLSPRSRTLDTLSVHEINDTLLECSRKMKASEQVVSRFSSARTVETQINYATSSGTQLNQDFSMVFISNMATAQAGTESQIRSHTSTSHQIGAEAFERDQLISNSERIGRESLELLTAENCPSATMDLLPLTDQMDLQIHESIGHPLELDRILGDERNYAGWSFVKPADFGHLQYGSKLMNITFDPKVEGQLASYAFDDGGNPATREYLIKEGRLLRGLGGLESQRRLGVSGVANFRASSWNRAPIDRMANINLEPGTESLESMIAKVERGIMMATNRSWSIDDYRNKFQFGCEYGRLIENGRLTRVVKNPNYRGTTVAFWNNLAAVGSANLLAVHGTPYCGKGEPNQAIRVGHATPPCLFRAVEVFGGPA